MARLILLPIDINPKKRTWYHVCREISHLPLTPTIHNLANLSPSLSLSPIGSDELSMLGSLQDNLSSRTLRAAALMSNATATAPTQEVSARWHLHYVIEVRWHRGQGMS